MTKDEALALALNALHTKGEHHPRVYEAIAAIQTVLAQPAQEPVKCAVRDCQNHMHQGQFVGSVCLPCYITPPQREWVGLTDEEIDEGNKQSWVSKQAWQSAVWWASEKLKEKNNG